MDAVAPPEGEPAPVPRSGAGKAVGFALLLLLLLAGGVFAATRYTLSNSYFVGSDEDGMITIYRGIPEEVAGLSLKESEERTEVSVSELPDFLRGDVEEGIKADSLEDARTKVENLEERANDSDFSKPAAGGKSN